MQMNDIPPAYAAAPRWPVGDSPELADELLALVLAGGKRATCSSLASCEADIMPTVGEISVILDGAGAPRCAIRTTEVEIMPFEQVSEDFARAEGEGDLTYEWWRDAHEAYYRREGTWAPGMKVVCERFELVEVF
ncbi:ASCH domain-containing protein [Brevundimonas diminuta]|nr:ASCH domain protein [Brevundimonas diminuta ATCC 11568]OWR19828.1 ASCH domain-containing protein [Brevundimonas diminuta]